MRPQTGNREKKKRNERKKLRDGPLENLWGGRGWRNTKKAVRAREN